MALNTGPDLDMPSMSLNGTLKKDKESKMDSSGKMTEEEIEEAKREYIHEQEDINAMEKAREFHEQESLNAELEDMAYEKKTANKSSNERKTEFADQAYAKSTKKRVPMGSSSSTGGAQTHQIRNLPKDVITAIVTQIPELAGLSMTDQITAYVYCMSGGGFDINDKVAEVVRAYQKEDPMSKFTDEMIKMRRQLLNLSKQVSGVELVSSYLVFDRAGFRKNIPSTPRNIDFLESGVDDVLIRLKEQAETSRKNEMLRDGRPKR